MKKILMSIIGMAFMSLSTSAAAVTNAPMAMDVNATAVVSCTTTTSPLAFGNYSGAQVVASGGAGATCNAANHPFTMSFDQGANFNVTRRMADGAGNFMNYEIYTDSTRATVAGDGTYGTIVNTQTGTAGYLSRAVWGAIPAGQLTTPGIYTDVVNVTVTY